MRIIACASLPSVARRRIGAGPCRESGVTTYSAGAPELLLLSQALQIGRQLHAPDSYAVGPRQGMV
ncbi:MAG TPA: hypothetical protein VEF89_14415, partial [Solirubrobacteraceae bacterium]|nr:hypothetical protein [Solirubrobacteraceae bacterium]